MQIDIPGGTAEVRDRPTIGGRSTLTAKASVMFGLMDEDTSRQGIDITTEEGQKALSEDDSQVRAATRWSEATLEAMEDYQNALLVAMLKSWTIPFPLPTKASIEDVEDEQEQAAIYAIRNALFPNWLDYLKVPDFSIDSAYTQENGKTVPVMDSPTIASEHSNGSVKDEAVL